MESELQVSIEQYREDGNDKLIYLLNDLAGNVYDGLVKKMKFIYSKEKMIEDTVDVCLEKLSRYDKNKGKAFNFLSTVMMCFMRQCKERQDYTKLKEMYVKSQTSNSCGNR